MQRRSIIFHIIYVSKLCCTESCLIHDVTYVRMCYVCMEEHITVSCFITSTFQVDFCSQNTDIKRET